MSRIFLSPPHVGQSERDFLLDAFDSNWIAPLGPHVDAFEQEVATQAEVPYAAALSSGTAALHLALKLVGVCSGDEVLVSSLTFAATANAVTYCGATPVFIDSEEATWNIDPELVAEELKRARQRNKLPKAILVVDLYGQCADYERLIPLSEEYGVPIIEDAAESLGATYRSKPAGYWGLLSAFSFNGNKMITTGGGGMLVGRNQAWIEKARFWATQARDPAPHYEHSEIGYNYRLNNLLAAVGRAQLRTLPDRVEQRRKNYASYAKSLSEIPGVLPMPESPKGKMNCWLTCITVNAKQAGISREDMRLALHAYDIEARPVWKPMHLQPIFRDCRMVGGSVSESLFNHGLCLPSGSNLTDLQHNRVTEILLRLWHSQSK